MRANTVILFSDWAKNDAINYYVISEDKIKVLCFGANLIDRYKPHVYLLTDYPLIREVVFLPLKYMNSMSDFEKILLIFLYAIMLTFVCMGIDSIRKCLYNYIENKLNI